MWHYPKINPIAFHIGPLPVHWYGIMYLLGFMGGWFLLSLRAKRSGEWTSEQLSDLIFYVALGVIVGGRVGYMFFYQWPDLVAHPLDLFKVWDGGMSFHGGMLGVMIAMFFCQRIYKKNFFRITDFIVPVVPIGLGLGRIGNFINGELPGDVMKTPHWWGLIYPFDPTQMRYPSSIIQFLLEGVLLFILMWTFSRKPRPMMAVSGMFSLLYGCFRFFDEFFRAPDPQLGYQAFGWLTRGQQLCIPMIFFGLILLFLAYRKKRSAS